MLRKNRRGTEVVSSETSTAHCLSFNNNENKYFYEDFPALPKENFQIHCNLLFVLTSLQSAAERTHHPELSGENLRLEMFSLYHLE